MWLVLSKKELELLVKNEKGWIRFGNQNVYYKLNKAQIK